MTTPLTKLDVTNLHALAVHFEAAVRSGVRPQIDRKDTETAAGALRRAVTAMQAAGWGAGAAEPQHASEPATEACRPYMAALFGECDGNARAGPDNRDRVKRCGECGTWFVVGGDGDRHYRENHPEVIVAARKAGEVTDSPRGYYRW
jgi:hypothetical protein